MCKMWQLLLLVLLANSVRGATERKVGHNRLGLGAVNGLYEDSADSGDYYDTNTDADNEKDNDHRTHPGHNRHPSETLNIDIDIDYSRPRARPGYTASSAAVAAAAAGYRATATPSSAHLRRVPRHPSQSHRSGSYNRLDASAAFDEEEGYQSDQAPGVLTAQKQQELGSPDGVQKSRDSYERQRHQAQELIRLARLHVDSMANEPLCKQPQARVISMLTETAKVYSPRHTVLHRCDENSSCCTSNQVWAVKNQTTVHKVFWVRTFNNKHSVATTVAMTNHTECHCISRTAQRRKRSSQCECPKQFISFSADLLHGGATPRRCRCDCHLSNPTCQRMKNGDEGFAVSELKCIRSNECSPPICSYGVFNMALGRCPRSTQAAQPRQLGFG